MNQKSLEFKIVLFSANQNPNSRSEEKMRTYRVYIDREHS